jgi:soluble lytic murein transglycosylase-like protein
MGLVLTGLTLLAGLVLVIFSTWEQPPRYIPQEEVWRVVQREAARHDLDPRFVFAVVAAESSFNARAVNGDARGLMQLRPPAWETVSDRPFRHAWRWEQNIAAGTAYLAHLREFLQRHGQFSYPHLAACYRHGPYRVKGVGFRLDELPAPRNRIYRQLHEGNLAPVDVPAR